MKFLTTAEAEKIIEDRIEKVLLAIQKPLTYKTAAEHLSMTESTLRTKVCKGEIPSYLVHRPEKGNVYFFAHELNHFIRGGQ
jgi:hypothetical protein